MALPPVSVFSDTLANPAVPHRQGPHFLSWYGNGAWHHAWRPGGPLPYDVAFYAVPGHMLLSGQREPWRPVKASGPPLYGETGNPEPSIFTVEQVEEIISRLSAGKRQVPFFALYRPIEGEPGIYELLDDAGKVVACADEEGIHQLQEARRP